ncbi:nuclear transport factor 2 family protein [Flavobacterium sp. 5]|uniref:nuclear transport factor 2 family protein n=1 Tax=Flavobacterium sp. 5 TaxID=2035199 RepID=UPI000C2C9CE4|nr:nuclear transport factor 2 family protein [Flavobacterium sp. 5]PKB18778.1 SnoaL-like protein [Flavobacterium sp. 5]
MTTDNLTKNQLSEERFNWLKEAYTIIDSLDANTNHNLYAENSEVIFGNRPAVQGRENIITMFKHFWTTIEGYSHSFVSVFGQDDAFAVETVVNYTRLDATTIGIPAVTVIEMNEKNQIQSMRIFIDIAPLHQI